MWIAVQSTKQAVAVQSGAGAVQSTKQTGEKTTVVDRNKPEGTSSAIFGVGTAAKYCELKRCANLVCGRTDNKDEVIKGKFSSLNFLPSTKKKTELYLSIYKKLTSVELNHFAKQAKLSRKNFFKSDGGRAISCQEKQRLCKRTERFPTKKRWHSPPPPPVGLSWDSPTRVCTNGQSYADITTKISRIHGLPNLHSNGAPRVL